MRTYLLIISAVACLGVGFFFYLWMVPAPAHHADATHNGPTALPTSGGNEQHPFGDGHGAWVNMYDKKTDELSSRFRTQEYLPHSDGTYHLVNPEADLYQHDGSVIHFIAAEGDVRMPEAAQNSGLNGGAVSMPNWGVFQDVTVTTFAGPAAQDANTPDISIHMENAEFDNDTFRLYTTPVIDPATGKVIRQADDVPVTMAGKDMDFNGTGLIMYWSDLTHDLKSLQIAHGHRLHLTHTSAGSPKEKIAPTTQQARMTQQASNLPNPTTEPGDLARKASEVETASKSPATPTTAPSGPREYVATFKDNVRVVQSGQDHVTANQMDVTFVRHEDAGDSGHAPTTAPVNADHGKGDHAARLEAATATEPSFPIVADTAPTTAPSEGELAATLPAGDANVHGPTSQPSREPVDVYWTGPLTIVPNPMPIALLPGQSVVRFIGSPVHIAQDDTDIYGQNVRYNTANGAARLAGVPGQPVTIIRKKPDGSPAATVINDGTIKYSQASQIAVFTGKGSAVFPDPEKAGTELRAAWDKSCVITLAGVKGEQVQIQRAELEGNASVIDADTAAKGLEKLKLSADDIGIDFARSSPTTRPLTTRPTTREVKPAEPSPTVKQVVATGNANCVIRDANAPPKSIDTDKLTVQTDKDATGEIYPRFIIADGKVHASDGQQDLRSHHLDVTLAPIPPERRKATTRAVAAGDDDASRVELETLLATGDVHANGKDGSTAVGDALHVETIDGQPLITLIGDPPAIVSGNGGVLRGAELQLKPKGDWAAVPGAGTMDAVQAAKPGMAPKPMHVQWTNGLVGDGAANLVDIKGEVKAETKDPRGTINTGSADHVILKLAPTRAPSTRPAQARHSTTKPSTNPSAGALADAKVDFMKDKQVELVTLLADHQDDAPQDNAEILSVLTAPDGSILHRADITGKTILVYMLEKRLVVPVKGQMLLEDHVHPKPGQPAAGAPAASPVEPPVDDGPPGGKGATAFQWEKQFTFDQIAQQAIMDGPVVIVHQPDGAHSEPTRMIADRVITDFEPADVKPTTQPTDDDTPPLKLKQMRAEGNVQIKSKNTTIEATEVIYDPIKEILIARGREGDPVIVEDGKSHDSASFREVQFDTRTNQITKMTDFSGKGGR